MERKEGDDERKRQKEMEVFLVVVVVRNGSFFFVLMGPKFFEFCCGCSVRMSYVNIVRVSYVKKKDVTLVGKVCR